LRNKTERRKKRVYLKIGKKLRKEREETWIISLFACCIPSPPLPPLILYNSSILLFTFTDTRDEIDDKAEIDTHIQDYLTYLKSGAILHNGIDGMQVETVVVVAFYKKNAKVP
jgi:hypothetical protein